MYINNFGVKLKRYPTAEQEFPWKSWRDIRWYLITDEIKLIKDLSAKFHNNQFEEIQRLFSKLL